jgi:hypothetical protein
MKNHPHRLVMDPYLPWPGGLPYERLNRRLQSIGHVGIGPESTVREIHDLLFDLMQLGDTTGDDQLAWNELQQLGKRLIMDFFLYQVPIPARGPDDRLKSIGVVDEVFVGATIAGLAPGQLDCGPQPEPAVVPSVALEIPVNLGLVPCLEVDVEKPDDD